MSRSSGLPALWLARALVWLLGLSPLGWLLLQAMQNQLGANPVEVLTHESGLWGLYFLLLSLLITPLRRLGLPGWLLKLRRLLGLFAFFYASLHLVIYLWLDQFFNLASIFEDILKRPYITLGFSAWLLLLPLAVTSNRASIRRLGRYWQKLHRLVYPAALLVMFHFIWLVKADYSEPLAYLAILLVLLALRLVPLPGRQT